MERLTNPVHYLLWVSGQPLQPGELEALASAGPDVPAVVQETNPYKVLRRIQENRPCAVVASLDLHEEGILEWCRRWSTDSQFQGIPLIVASQILISASDRIAAFIYGADGVICRPCLPGFTLVEIQDLVHCHAGRTLSLTRRFHSIFDFSQDPVLLLDAELSIQGINPEGVRLLGIPARDLYGKQLASLSDPLHRESLVNLLADLIQDRTAYIDDFPFPALEKTLSLRISTACRVEWMGQSAALVHLQDNSARQQVMDALWESKLRAEAVLNTAVDAIILIDTSGKIESCNPAACRMFGYQREDLVGRPVHVLMPEPHRSRHSMYMSRYLDTGEKHIIGLGREEVGLRSNGEVFPIELAVSEISIGDRRMFTGIIRDIGDRKAAEQERDRLALAIEQTAEAVVITDLTGQIIYVNPAFESDTGYSAAEVIGQNPRILKSERTDAETFDQLWETITCGMSWTGHVINRRKDGRLIDVLQNITPIVDPQQKIVNYVSVWRNVTLEWQLQEQVRQSQKLDSIGRLASGIAHDFNNVLAAIMGYAEILRERADDHPEFAMHAREIVANAERGAKLTRLLLTFGRRQKPTLEPVSLNEVLLSMDKLLRRSMPENIELVILPMEDIPIIQGDFVQLEQVVMNLVLNARDAIGGGGGKLTVSTESMVLSHEQVAHVLNRKAGSYCVLRVADTGCGMSPEVLDRIFEPLFTTKGEGSGTGLGLAVAYGIVTEHGGWIDVESHPGRGSQFDVYLPGVPKEVLKVGNAEEAPVPQGGESILLIEDDSNVRRAVKTMLESLGYQVLAAASGMEALEISYNLDGVDAVISDVVMPQMSGQYTVERLADQFSSFKVLFISGFANEHIELNLWGESRRIQVLKKPFNRQILGRMVRQLLDS